MQAYVVRLKDTKELVSITIASSLNDLAFLVDECTDVDQCEYARLPAGGIYWPDREAAVVPSEIDENGDGPDMFKGAEISEYWLDYLHGDKARWKPVLEFVE